MAQLWKLFGMEGFVMVSIHGRECVADEGAATERVYHFG